MNQELENWKADNKKFCNNANKYEVEVLWTTEVIIFHLDRFRLMQINKDKEYIKVDINRLINKLGKIRSILQETQNKQ